MWAPPSLGKALGNSAALSAGQLVGGPFGALVVAGAQQDAKQRARNAPLANLKQVLEQEEWLRKLWRQVLQDELASHGLQVAKTVELLRAAPGHLQRARAEVDAPHALIIQSAEVEVRRPLVALGIDDRQLIIGFSARRYELSRQRHRVRSVRDLVYVGTVVPEGEEPIAYWTADDARILRKEMHLAVTTLLNLALAEEEFPEAAKRKEFVDVPVGGVSRRFSGRLWKQTEHMALLRQRGDAVTVISLATAAALPTAKSPTPDMPAPNAGN
ncbi:MAG: hypothetical protein ACT4NL_02990 [Pseudomarimonas sp.]